MLIPLKSLTVPNEGCAGPRAGEDSPGRVTRCPERRSHRKRRDKGASRAPTAHGVRALCITKGAIWRKNGPNRATSRRTAPHRTRPRLLMPPPPPPNASYGNFLLSLWRSAPQIRLIRSALASVVT
ncbi:unnamed protein product, partial [Iphiclides podalirius]